MQLVSYAARFFAVGALVCVFALISEVCTPKRFAGIFSAAPSVLVASLAITLVAQNSAKAVSTAEGAIAGAVGLIAYCLVSTPAIRRFKSLAGSGLAVIAWSAVAVGMFIVLDKVIPR